MKLRAGLIAAVVALAGANAQATTLLVSNTNDSGAGSLRQAVGKGSVRENVIFARALFAPMSA